MVADGNKVEKQGEEKAGRRRAGIGRKQKEKAWGFLLELSRVSSSDSMIITVPLRQRVLLNNSVSTDN